MPAKFAKNLKLAYSQVAEGYQKNHEEVQETEALDTYTTYLKPKSHILDLGGGVGTESEWFLNQGFEVTLFDLSPEMLAIAKRKMPAVEIIQGDMTEMSFNSETFDGVWARASLHHVTKLEARSVVKKVFEILKNDGVFLCTLKKGEGEQEVEDGKHGKKVKRFFAYYEQTEAEELLKSAGFSDVKSITHQTPSGQLWVQVRGFKK